MTVAGDCLNFVSYIIINQSMMASGYNSGSTEDLTFKELAFENININLKYNAKNFLIYSL